VTRLRPASASTSLRRRHRSKRQSTGRSAPPSRRAAFERADTRPTPAPSFAEGEPSTSNPQQLAVNPTRSRVCLQSRTAGSSASTCRPCFLPSTRRLSHPGGSRCCTPSPRSRRSTNTSRATGYAAIPVSACVGRVLNRLDLQSPVRRDQQPSSAARGALSTLEALITTTTARRRSRTTSRRVAHHPVLRRSSLIRFRGAVRRGKEWSSLERAVSAPPPTHGQLTADQAVRPVDSQVICSCGATTLQAGRVPTPARRT